QACWQVISFLSDFGTEAAIPAVEGIDFSALEAAVFQETDLLTRSDRQHAAAAEPQSDEILESDA
ncbi:unnamed protein product, partial [Effrenium voratum]